MNKWVWNNTAHFVAIGIFIAVALLYCNPLLQGKKLAQTDFIQAQGMQKEIQDYKKADGNAPLWTNTMFGGMPAYQIWTQYPANISSYIISYWNKWLPNPVSYILMYLLGAYFCFAVLKLNSWLAIMGAIAMAFTTYNFVIIEAGHASKSMAIAFFAPSLAGMLLALQGRYVYGGLITACALSLEIRSGHPQMTFYLMLVVIVLLITALVHAFLDKQIKTFFKASLAIALAAFISLGINAGSLWVNYEYAKETIRGEAILGQDHAAKDKLALNGGLSKAYAYSWSQGIGESITCLIPDAYGGASGIPFTKESGVYKTLINNHVPAESAMQFAAQLGTHSRYWGEKPFTSGPYYFGAVIVFLFAFALMHMQGLLRTWIMIAVLLTLMLSWGRHFQGFSDIFFDYFPFYNKFRAVESILAITGILVSLFTIMGLQSFFEYKNHPQSFIRRLKYVSIGMASLLLLFLALPNLFLTFQSAADIPLLQQLNEIGQKLGNVNFGSEMMEAIYSDRVRIARSDTFRSLVFIILAALTLYLVAKKKLLPVYGMGTLALLTLIDLWGIDKRYLNNDKFVNQSALHQYKQPRSVDLQIMVDKEPYYRVYDATIHTFNDATASYFHKTIGGYHAVKLRRYQDLIEQQIQKGNQAVLNMLNTRYLIVPDRSGKAMVKRNPDALGNAWFPGALFFAPDADAEMAALAESWFNPADHMIVHSEFGTNFPGYKKGEKLNGLNGGGDILKLVNGNSDQAKIRLTSYHPEHLAYAYDTGGKEDGGNVIVFSDIYYHKGWNAYLDGKPYPYFRCNYALRAMNVPAGSHTIDFKFEPKSYRNGERISLACSVLLLAGMASTFVWRKRMMKN